MLPASFHFERYIDGPGLYVGAHAVAMASPANYDPDPPWRITINPNSVRRRFAFTDTEEQAVRYMAAWSRKWEPEILAEVASLTRHVSRPRRENLDPRPPTRAVVGRAADQEL